MIRITIFMGTDNFTWTESHYHASATTIAAAAGDATDLELARLAILTKPASILEWRLSDTTKPRQAQPFTPDGGADIGTFDPGGDPEDKFADRPYSSILVAYTGKNGYTSRGFMSGIPDVAVTEDTGEVGGIDPTFGPIFNKQLQRYIKVLASAWGWRRIDSGATVPVIGLDAAGLHSGEIGITTAAALTFSAQFGVKVNVTGFRTKNPRTAGLRGVYAVDQAVAGFPPAAAPFSYYLRGTNVAAIANLTQQLGKVCPLNYVVEPYASGVLEKATHRKRGVRALAPLGRSRSRPC